MKWASFLHLYQPPTQTREVIDQVVRESYSLILDLLDRHPRLRLTVNLSGSLIELLEAYGHGDIIRRFAAHVAVGRVELVGSAMYHPIMPLVPVEEIRRQVQLQNEVLAKHFGSDLKLRGFFLPEMAYSAAVGKEIKKMGFEWVILDPIHAVRSVDPHFRYTDEASGLKAVFRDVIVSKHFPPEYIVDNLDKVGDVVVTAHDGELYGHWHKDDHGYYDKAFSSTDIETVSISEYVDGLGKDAVVVLRDASWESTEGELAASVPFALWDAPDNEVHRKLWLLARQAKSVILAHADDQHFKHSSQVLGKGFASCAWWWGSGRKIGPWSPVSWNPTEIMKGASLMLEAVRTLKKVSSAERLKAEKAFTALHDLVWHIHWEKYAV